MKGKKDCPSCNNQCGVRQIKCDCGHEFVKKIARTVKIKRRKVKRRPSFVPTDKWQDIEPGEVFKVSRLGGPYYRGESGNIPMGYSGFFTAIRVQSDGILGLAIGKNASAGYCHIYMGPEKIGITDTIMVAHHILRKPEHLKELSHFDIEG